MNRKSITIILFIVTQFLLWLVCRAENIVSDEEVVTVTIFFGVMFGLTYWKNWMRWVVGVLLVFPMLIIASLTFEGFGVGFILISFLYALIIYLVITSASASAPADQTPDPNAIPDLLPPVTNGFHAGGKVYHYPLLMKRYQSLFIDFVLAMTVMVVTMSILGNSELRNPIMLAMAAIFLFVYEPLLTAYSATVGQRIVGIRVRNSKNPDQRIGILYAYIRVIVKGFLGWLSFVTINFNEQHRAIHDFASDSVVVKIGRR